MWAQMLLLDVQGCVETVGLPAKTSFRAAKIFVGKAQTIDVNGIQHSQLVVPTSCTTHFSICLINHDDNSRSFEFTNVCDLNTLVNEQVVPKNETIKLIPKKDYIVDIALDTTGDKRLIWKFTGHMKRGVQTQVTPQYSARKKRRRDAVAKAINTASTPFGISATVDKDGVTAPTANYFAWQVHQTEETITKAHTQLLQKNAELQSEISKINAELALSREEANQKIDQIQHQYNFDSQQMKDQLTHLKEEMYTKVQYLTMQLHESMPFVKLSTTN